MAYPPAYVRAFSFTDYETNNPGQPKPGDKLDTEYDAVANALTATQNALALIQRADGALANDSVGADQLQDGVFDGIVDGITDDAEAAAAAATASASAAAGSASAASASASAAASSAGVASGAAAQAGVSQGIAQDAANEAALSAAESDASAVLSEQSANDTAGSVAACQGYVQRSFEWAELLTGPVLPAPPGWPEAVDDGMFSSKWWALRARDYMTVTHLELGSGQANIGDAMADWLAIPGNEMPLGLVYATWGTPPLEYALTDPSDPTNPASWTLISGGPGPPGPPNTLTIGTVTVGIAAATITGTAPNQVLNLTLPPGPPNTLTIGTVTGGTPGDPPSVTITGIPPNQVLNFVLPPSPMTFADPTALVTLVNQVGDSTAAMRSDAAPALSQAIIPTWTGLHTWGVGGAIAIVNDDPIIVLSDTAQGLDNKRWMINANGTFDIYALKDGGGSSFKPSLRLTRSGEALTSIQFGNATDNQTFDFLGSGVASFHGQVNIAATGQPLIVSNTATSPVSFLNADGPLGPYITMARSGVPFVDYGNASSNLIAGSPFLDGFAITTRGATPIIFGHDSGFESARFTPTGALQITGAYSNGVGVRAAPGLEIYVGATQANLLAFNRATAAYLPLTIASTYLNLTDSSATGGDLRLCSRRALVDLNDGWLRINNAADYLNGTFSPGFIYSGAGFQSNGGLSAGGATSPRIRPNLTSTGGLNYGSVNVDGGTNGYAGYGINDALAAVFMSNGITTGIIVSSESKWIIYRQSATHVFSDYILRASSFESGSSRNIKRETGKPSRARDMLSRLRPLLYRLLDGDDREQLGLIAEEVHEVCPQLSDGKAVAYDRLAILLLAAWQDEHATA